MSGAPPKFIELIVELLTPPACREHLLGDLRERYSGLGCYVLDALSTLPRIVLSRIRRTTDVRMLALEAGALATAFSAAAMNGLPYLESALWRLPIPILAGLTGLRIAAAYTSKPLVHVFAAFAAMLAAQSTLPLPRGLFLTAVAWSVLLIATVRTLWPRRAPAEAATLDELRARALGFEKSIRRRNYREYIAAALIVLCFIWKLSASQNRFQLSGSIAIIGTMAYVAIQLHRRGKPRSIPADAPPTALLEFYRTELRRQRDLYRAAWSHKLAPITLAVMLALLGDAAVNARIAQRVPLMAGPMLLLILLAWKWNQDLASQLEREIADVESARDRL